MGVAGFHGDFKGGDWYLKEHSIRYINYMLENPQWNVGGGEDWVSALKCIHYMFFTH
eukprot:SAG11_NODE_100_length_16863_cov_12.374911_8_plen_57_part_00